MTASEIEQAFLDAYDTLARGDGVRDDEVAKRWLPLYDRLRRRDHPAALHECDSCEAST